MIRNYRVCFRVKALIPTYQVHEVFYDNHYDIIGYEKTPAIAFGDIKEELYENFCDMMKAFDEVPLNLDYVDHLIKVKEYERKSNSD